MIKVNSLSKTYDNGVEALKGINLEVKKGEIYGIIGFSGAGKSSLIRCLNLLEIPTQGDVYIDGENITMIDKNQLRAVRRQMGMIFQHFNLLSSRTVAENIAFPLEIAGVDKKIILDKVNNMLKLVGLEDKANMYPSQLSGGQKQRVGIARALANDPKVLLCDEATSALDPQTTKAILRLLKEINQQLGLTIVLITHEMEVIKEICDSVAVIEDGLIIEKGPVLDIFTKPKNVTTKEFVSSVINHEIPDEVKSRLIELKNGTQGGDIIRVIFIGKEVGQPIISNIVKQFNVDVNIMLGTIDHIKDQAFGVLLLELLGGNQERVAVLEYLKQNNILAEVIENVG